MRRWLPLVWAATLAHYLDLFLNEAGRILPVSPARLPASPPPPASQPRRTPGRPSAHAPSALLAD